MLGDTEKERGGERKRGGVINISFLSPKKLIFYNKQILEMIEKRVDWKEKRLGKELRV